MSGVLFEPHPKQKEFIDAVFSGRFRHLLFGGAAGGGKSYVSLATLILLAKVYPNSKSFVIRESLPSLKRTTIHSFFKLCPKIFIKSFNQTDQVVRFRNGSSLTFFPENYVQDKNLTRFDGIEANFFLIEEGQECQRKTFEKCKLRAGRHIIPGMDRQPMPIIMVTCNPSQNWTKEVFHEPSIKGELPSDHYYLQSLMVDNPSLPDTYLEGLANIDEMTREIFVKGNWDIMDVERPFAYAFQKNRNVRPGLQIKKGEPIILSFDFNVDPITCLAGQSYNGSIIKSQVDLPKSSFKVPNINPSIKNSRVLVNSILERHPEFAIDSSCQWLINDLQSVQTDAQGDIDKSKDKHSTHLLDCFRYFLWTYHHDFIKFIK